MTASGDYFVIHQGEFAMNSRIHLSTVAALLGFALVAAPVHAQVFVGGTIGESMIDDYEFSAGDTDRNEDDNDTAFHLFLGYQFNEYLAIAAGYADLGQLDASATNGVGPYTDSIEATAMDFSAIGILPFSMFAGDGSFLSRIALFGQVGMQLWNQDVDCVACEDDGSNFRGGDTGTDIVYGGGLNVGITDHASVHARYVSYPDIGGSETGHQQDWDMWGIGAIWNFGN